VKLAKRGESSGPLYPSPRPQKSQFPISRLFSEPTSNFVRILSVIAIALLTGCATRHTLSLPTAPLRRLDALVVYDPSYKLTDVQKCVTTSSLRLNSEFGIQIVPVEFRVYVSKDSDSTREVLQQVRCINQDDQYDMVIGFARRIPKALVNDTLGGWIGVTDDVCRRYIVMKSPDSYTLTHELLHMFVYAFEHESQLGQLSSTQINLVPLVPEASIRSDAISNAVYAEVMKNKWRDFRKTDHETR
jgi:hypothetical protein